MYHPVSSLEPLRLGSCSLHDSRTVERQQSEMSDMTSEQLVSTDFVVQFLLNPIDLGWLWIWELGTPTGWPNGHPGLVTFALGYGCPGLLALDGFRAIAGELSAAWAALSADTDCWDTRLEGLWAFLRCQSRAIGGFHFVWCSFDFFLPGMIPRVSIAPNQQVE